MTACNVTQNELGGKELLLKACNELTIATTDTSETITSVAHGLKVGDMIFFTNLGALTSVTNGEGDFYFVKTIIDADNFEVSATATGAAIAMDATEASLVVLGFKSIGGLRSKSFAFSTEGIEITNQESDEWKTLLDGAGVRSFSVSGSGVYTNDEVFQSLFEASRNNALICLMFIDVKVSRVFEGCFKITSLEISGDYNAEGAYSISAESSGKITVVKL